MNSKFRPDCHDVVKANNMEYNLVKLYFMGPKQMFQ